MSIRPVKRLIKSKPTTEGAGVHLRRTFGFGNTSDFDLFGIYRFLHSTFKCHSGAEGVLSWGPRGGSARPLTARRPYKKSQV
jgi:hypothetical protein